MFEKKSVTSGYCSTPGSLLQGFSQNESLLQRSQVSREQKNVFLETEG